MIFDPIETSIDYSTVTGHYASILGTKSTVLVRREGQWPGDNTGKIKRLENYKDTLYDIIKENSLVLRSLRKQSQREIVNSKS